MQLSAGMNNQGQTVWLLQVYYRRLLIALSALVLVGWLLAATGLFLWLDRAPRNQVGWLDLAAPWRWSGLRAKRGDSAVLAALDELKARDYTNAYYNLRVGLARSPGNVDGRLALARLIGGHEPAQAVALLEEGLPHAAGDPKLVSGLLGFYSAYQVHSHALEVVDGLLQGKPGALSPETRFVLQRSRVALLAQLGRLPEAEAALAAVTAPVSPAERAGLTALQIELLLRSGRTAEAKILSDQAMSANSSQSGTLRQAAEVAIILGDADALQSALRRLKAQAPDNPGAYLLGLQGWHRMKRQSLRDAAEQEYYRAFGGSDAALQALAALAVNLDLPEVLARAQRVAVASRLSPFAFRVHQTELALRRGETEAATRHLRDWETSIDTLKTPQRFYPEFIKRLTRAAFAGTPDQTASLLSHLAANRGQAPLPVWQLAASVLEKSGHPTGAGQVLQAGLVLFPHSDPLLLARQRVAELAATATARAAATKENAPDAPQFVIIVLPATPGEASRQLGQLLQQDSLAAARDLLRAIRAQKPAWLPLIETEVSLREVELAFLSLDQIASRNAARAFLDRYRAEEDGLRLVALVSRLVARNRPAEARLLYDEVAAASPAAGRVRQALLELKLADDLAATIASQPAALAELDRWILLQEWAQAERLLKHLHDKPPAWLTAGLAEVKLREVQIRLGLDQRPLAVTALKELVIRGGAARSAAFKLVRDLLARDEPENARLLAREIARLLPGDPAAAHLVREAEAPQAVSPGP